jgi:hypothetical protein
MASQFFLPHRLLNLKGCGSKKEIFERFFQPLKAMAHFLLLSCGSGRWFSPADQIASSIYSESPSPSNLPNPSRPNLKWTGDFPWVNIGFKRRNKKNNQP